MAYETERQRGYKMARKVLDEAEKRQTYCPMTGHECVGRRCAAAMGRAADLTDRLRTHRKAVAVWECTAYPAKRRVDVAELPEESQ